MKSIIHVAQAAIAKNRKLGTNDPPLIVRTHRGAARGHEIEIHDAAGAVVARVVYRPHDPLSCGARLWIETEMDVRLS